MNLILVTGGTGTLGRPLVELLTSRGAAVRLLSRRPRPAPAPPHEWCTGDLRRGRGIEEAVAGAGTIIHCATGRGDIVAARVLLAAARRAGRPHLVYISIVGIDRVPVGYYRSKLATERLIADCGLPWTILRATQFHDLIARGCAVLARLPVLPVPAATSFQPVDAGEVAARLAELATGTPSGRVSDMAGPQVRAAADLARSYLGASGRYRRVQPVWLPGRAAAAARRGGLLAPGHASGQVSFEDFLASRLGAGTAAHAGPHRAGETPSGAGGQR
jgi:uncharacterized protein YbjT (DUF2867 family)